jgi:PAS domain S-box-containing protein
MPAAVFADALADIVCVWRGLGSLEYANRAWFEFTGCAREDPVAFGWRAALHPADAERIREAFAAAAPGATFEIQFRLRRRDGAYRWMLARVAPLAAGDGDVANRTWAGTCFDIDERKQAEFERDCFRVLADSGALGIAVTSATGHVIDANEKFLRMTGYDREDVRAGKLRWQDMTPSDWAEADGRAVSEFYATGAITPYEKEFFRKDGTRVPLEIGIAGKNDVATICYVSDLTELRRSQAAQRVSDARLRRLFDANVVGIVIANNAGAILEANDAFLGMLGYTREELESGLVDWRHATPAEWLPLDERAIAEMASCGVITPYEKEYVRRDGTRVPVTLGGARIADTDDEQICYVVDLSERRDSMRRLEESEERYRLLAEALPEIIMMTDEDRRPVYVNRRYEEYTGIAAADVEAKWLDALHPDDLTNIRRVRATGESYEVEYRLRRFDGVYRWHLARVLKMPGASRQARWLGAMMDIDDRKRAEQSLRFIEKAGTLLSRSLDLETTLATVLDLVLPEFGDWAAINLRDESGEVKTLVARHADPAKDRFARELHGVAYYRETPSWGTAQVFVSGEPRLDACVGRADIEAAVKDEYLHLFEALGYGSVIALPIFSGDEVVGSFGIVSENGRRTYTQDDVKPLEELARRAGFAIANARQYEREHRVASLLQEAALPRKLPVVDGFTFDGYYRAGRQEALIGGDWFDVLVVSDGRIVVSVGDVAGSGLYAAMLMGNVRQVIRGAANVYADPMMILDVADRTLRSEGEDRMVTAFVGVIDPVRKAMVYASAGHLPALLRTLDGRVASLTTPGLPLGYRSFGGSASQVAMLPEGSCLLLYTDGLVEWSRDILAGEALLRRKFADALGTSAAHPAKALVDSILLDGGARDDVAALTVTAATLPPTRARRDSIVP